MKTSRRSPDNKPWAKLRMSRREYETKRPWAFRINGKKMDRKRFESLLLQLDQETIDDVVLEGQAEDLLRGAFGVDAV